MFNLQKYKNKKVAIYGMGITGRSSAKAYQKLNAKVYCWDDDKKIREKAKKLNFPLKKFWLSKIDVDKIIISPGIDINKCKIKKFLIKNKKKISTDLDLFFEFNKDSKIISITGTNGKSTTCKLIEKILKTSKYNVVTAGNIGRPILSFSKSKKENIYILEVSSYQLQYSKLFRSKHAAILNISPDHLERHKNMENYIRVKSKIFFGQKGSDYSYINAKNRYSKKISKLFKNKKIKSKLTFVKERLPNSFLKKIQNNYFNSKGYYENLIFAYVISKNLKVSDKLILKAVNKFKGLPHRQEIIFSNKKILCVNDSKATSFDASLQSLSNYNKIYWIVGGMPKHKDYFNLKAIKNKIIKAYIVGNHTHFFKNELKKQIPYSVSNNIENAVNNIFKDIKKSNTKHKNTILLSPAAASFDQFQNFENRGFHFKKLIKKKFYKNKNV